MPSLLQMGFYNVDFIVCTRLGHACFLMCVDLQNAESLSRCWTPDHQAGLGPE